MFGCTLEALRSPEMKTCEEMITSLLLNTFKVINAANWYGRLVVRPSAWQGCYSSNLLLKDLSRSKK